MCVCVCVCVCVCARARVCVEADKFIDRQVVIKCNECVIKPKCHDKVPLGSC